MKPAASAGAALAMDGPGGAESVFSICKKDVALYNENTRK